MSISSASRPSNGIICSNTGSAFVNVPVLSKTTISAAAICSKNLPPFTVIPRREASCIADSTANGILSLSAQEKSTIRNESAFIVLRVSKYVKRVPAKLRGTSRSAMWNAFCSIPDFICSDSSMSATIFSYRELFEFPLTSMVHSPSSITVPA